MQRTSAVRRPDLRLLAPPGVGPVPVRRCGGALSEPDMTTTRTSHRLALLALALAASTTLGAQPTTPSTTKTAMPVAESSTRDDLEMMHAESAFRGTVDAFLASAASGDAARAAAMISPNLRTQAGERAVDDVVRTQVIPFFADFQKLGAKTITLTTDQFGSRGFTYYMYALPASGEPKPFVLYVVREGGRIVVANVLVNRYVEGRHP